ncbi:MAG: hypothetical protein ACD_30C00057G0006 [uncultured bacterium]|nr:MAG: hypothetical protein ACD_30C00057G0006 [uncultured bacterium]OGE32330.1 MAG: hypothetical protein A3C99_02280 [Candidatus Daviesbacteria bacterium RIFCSPHIGHO2_02_FULL_37_9]
MGIKSFLVILVLSVVVTYLLPYVNLFLPINADGFGFPIKYGTSSFFGGSSFDLFAFFIDVVFWFAVIWGVWKLLSKVFKR